MFLNIPFALGRVEVSSYLMFDEKQILRFKAEGGTFQNLLVRRENHNFEREL